MSVACNLMGDLQSILLAVDASEKSRGAVNEAIVYASRFKAKLYILFVHEYYPEIAESLTKAAEGVSDEVKKFLEDIKAKVEKEGGKAEIIIKDHSETWRAIVDEAERLKVDLIIMGKRGRTGLSKLFMGSVTEKVIGYAPCNVMVVPQNASIEGETILVATDGSYYAQKAEKEAISMGKRCASTVKKIIALSVVKNEGDLPKANTILEAFKARCKEEELPSEIKVETLGVVGNPADMIVKVAKDEGADLILMGEYGKTGLEKFIMGSTTERVIGLAKTAAVLVVCFNK